MILDIWKTLVMAVRKHIETSCIKWLLSCGFGELTDYHQYWFYIGLNNLF